ncbi:MAG: hypothetical protein WA708_17870 [Acidobacteriaceae bacterium]
MNQMLEYRNHSPFGTGLRLLLANKRLLLWVYLTNLAVGLYVGLPFHARISPILDHSLAAERIAGRFDVSAFGMLMMNLGKRGNSLHVQAFHAILVYGLIANILAAGIYYVFGTGELSRLSIVVRSGIEYFWRFFRLMLFAIVIIGPIMAALIALRGVILTHADNVYVGRSFFFISLVTLIILLLVGLFLRLWFDIAEASVIQLGQQSGVRHIRRTLGPSMRILWHRFGAAYFGYLLIAVLGAVGLAFFVWLWIAVLPPRAVFLAWVIGQLGVLCLLTARIWQRGLATALVLAAEPVIAPSEPVRPVPAAPSAPVEPWPESPASNPLAGETTGPNADPLSS